jgi:hypothetical protein
LLEGRIQGVVLGFQLASFKSGDFLKFLKRGLECFGGALLSVTRIFDSVDKDFTRFGPQILNIVQ